MLDWLRSDGNWFVPSERVLPLFYPVFDLSTTIVNRNYLVHFKNRVGHNETDTREEFTNVPFYFTNYPSGLISALCPVMELDHPHLYPALWGTTGSASRRVEYATLEAAVAGKPDAVGNAAVFAKLIKSGTGKCRIPPKPQLFEPRPVAVNQRRDKTQDAIG